MYTLLNGMLNNIIKFKFIWKILKILISNNVNINCGSSFRKKSKIILLNYGFIYFPVIYETVEFLFI